MCDVTIISHRTIYTSLLIVSLLLLTGSFKVLNDELNGDICLPRTSGEDDDVVLSGLASLGYFLLIRVKR